MIYSQEEPVRIASFCKVNWLHGWMEDKWVECGGTGDFNCVQFYLNDELLNQLEDDISNNRIEPAEGLFFGSPEIYPEDINDVTEMIKGAREELKDGRKIYYDSWW